MSTSLNSLVNAINSAINLTADQDAQLIVNGYEPIAVEGKRAVASKWTEGKVTVERISAERAQFPDAKSTGLRTGRLVGVDVDVVNEDHAEELVQLATHILGDTFLVRKGAKGGMLCYRNETSIRKITVLAGEAKIELLGEGQQLVAYGVHPDTKKPYGWIGGEEFDDNDPLTVPLTKLPAVAPDKLRQFANEAAKLLETLGYGEAKISGDTGEQKKSKLNSGGDPVAAKVLIDAAAYVDPFTGRDEWRDNIAAIRAANILGDDGLSARRRIAQDWSAGKLDKFKHFKDSEGKYTGPDAVDQVFDSMVPKPGGIDVGTFFKNAREGGWKGNPYDSGQTSVEAFGVVEEAPSIVPDAKAGALSEMDGLRRLYRLRDPVEEANRPPLEFWDAHKLFIKSPEGGVVVPYGDTGTHKTGLTLSKLIDLVFNHPEKPRVAYFAGEGSYAFGQARVGAACSLLGKTVHDLKARKQFHQISAAPLFNSDPHMRAVLENLRPFQPNIIVIDTFTRAMPGENFSQIDVASKAFAVADMLRRQFNALIVILHHEGKDTSKGAIGSKLISGNADTMLYLSKINDDVVKVHVEKMRDGQDNFSVGYRVERHNGVPALAPMTEVEFKTVSDPARMARKIAEREMDIATDKALWLLKAVRRDCAQRLETVAEVRAGEPVRDKTSEAYALQEKFIEKEIKRLRDGCKRQSEYFKSKSSQFLGGRGRHGTEYRMFLPKGFKPYWNDDEQAADGGLKPTDF